MECARCPIQPLIHAFTQANLDNSLGRMKTKQVISAVRDLQSKFKNVCETCKTAIAKHDTEPAIQALRSAWNTQHLKLLDCIAKQDETTRSAIDSLQSAFQAVCLTCSRSSNDDNPSNHGQTFVSLDSGNCAANSGRAATTATDDNLVQARADWIGLHAAPDSQYHPSAFPSPHEHMDALEEPQDINSPTPPQSQPQDPQDPLNLPPHIADTLRREFANFVSLDPFDKMLVSCLLSGMNISEFARMLWLPYSIVDPKTRTIKPVTKQAAHARWNNIIKKFPAMTAIAKRSSRKNAQAVTDAFLLNPNAAAPIPQQFQNGRMTQKAISAIERLYTLQTSPRRRSALLSRKNHKPRKKKQTSSPKKSHSPSPSHSHYAETNCDTEYLIPGFMESFA